MFKFIHSADIHLDSPLRGLERYEGAPVDAIRQATRRALENLVQLAIQNQVAFVLLAGDLYDGDWKEFRTGLFFVSQMVKLREASIPVYLIAGNHDAANKMTRRLPLPENVQVFPPDEPKTLILPDYDVAIHGQSFARASVLENLSQNYPAADRGLFNIGLLHTAATGREGHEPYAPCTVEGLRAKRYDYWALGHVHKQEVLCDDPPILFSGNVQGRHIRETGPKGCVLVTVDDRHATQFQWHRLDVFRWEYCRVDAAEAASGDDLLDRVRQRLAELVAAADGRSLAARVEVTGACRAHRALIAEPNRWTNEIRALAQDVGGGELWIEKVQLRTVLPADASGQSPDGPIGELIQRIAELKSDPEDLGRLGGEFADLLEKLPPELKEGADALGLERPETLRDMLDQVEQLLIHQLLARGAAVKILQLDLRAFGPFTGRMLDLSEGDVGLHVVYGPNEAGKSSALRAVEQMLFGIPARATDDFIHPYKNLRVGATLGRAGGPPLEFLRRKGTAATLLAADNETPLPDDALRPLLGAIDRELFGTMFGIDHQQLIQGGKEIVHGSGNVGQLLFATGAGIADFQAIQTRLENEAEELFTRRAHTRKINQSLKALDAARKRARQSQLPGEEWARHDEAFHAAASRRDEVQRQLQQCQREQSRLSRIRQAQPILAKHRELFQQRQALGGVKILPADFAEQRRAAITGLEVARNDAQKARDELERIQKQLQAIAVPTALLAKAAQIKELPDALGSHRKAQRDLPGLRARREQIRLTAGEILRQIRPDLSLAMAEPLRLTTLQRSAIADLGNRHAALVQSLEQSQQEIRETRQRLAAEQSQLAELEAPRPVGVLKDAIRRVQGQGNLPQQAADVRAELARRQQQAAVDLRRLPYWAGTFDELEALRVPAGETIDRFEKDFAHVEQQHELLRTRLAEARDAQADVDRQLDQSQREGEVPGEDDLAAARRLRDEGWRLVLESWQQGSADDRRLTEFLAAFASGTDLAAAYAQAVGRADECADRLRREAGRVATRAGLLAHHEALGRQIAAFSQQAAEARMAEHALQQSWQALWLAARIEPGRPREMRAWLQRQQSLVEEAAAIRVRLGEVQRIEECAKSAWEQLGDALAALAVPLPDAETPLPAMLDHCQAEVDRFEAIDAQRRQLQKSVRECGERLSAGAGRAERAATELAQWHEQWAMAIEPLGLPPDTAPTAVNQVVTQIVEMFARLAEIRDLDERIKLIYADAALFERQVGELASALAPELAGQEVAAAAERLIATCNQAVTAQSEQQNLRKQERRHQAVMKDAGDAIEGLIAQLRTMCQEAGRERAEDLPEAERASQTACRLDEQLAALEEQLLDLSAGAGIDALRSEAETVNADELPTHLEQWQRQIEELESSRSKLDQTIGEERNTLATMVSGAEAPEAAEEVQELLAALETDVQQYVRLRMAAAILRDGIERYRQKNEGPVLRRASELFRLLTLGSFDRLSADCDERGEKVLKGVRPGGGSVELAGMSEGTSDQLYLALRLASLETYLRSHEPIPFIVDDVLVTFDDARAAAALRALGDLSRQTQIIFFTHHQHLVRLAEETLDGGLLFVHAL